MKRFKPSRFRVPLSFAVGAAVLLTANPTRFTLLAGLPFVLLGGGMRTWSSGYIRKNRELAIQGPYAYTRNPLYVGNFLIGLGFVLMVNRPWLLILFPVFFFLVYGALVREEERALTEKFGEAFQDYMKRVPRFFPRPGGPAAAGSFEWSLVFKHHEYNAWLGMVTGVGWLLWKLQ